jgi:hypothetical protein
MVNANIPPAGILNIMYKLQFKERRKNKKEERERQMKIERLLWLQNV